MKGDRELFYKVLGSGTKEYGSSYEWTSESNPTFPCDVYLRLQHVARVNELRLLLHHAYIPNKIELLVSATSEVSGSSLQSLGVTYTDSNSNREFNTRELKSIEVSITCRVICLRFHGCHANSLNQEGRVALCGIMILGEYERTPKLVTNQSRDIPKGKTEHEGVQGSSERDEFDRRRLDRSGSPPSDRMERRSEEKRPRQARPLVKLPRALQQASTRIGLRSGNQAKVVDGEDEYEEEISVPAISLDAVPQGKVQVIEGLAWKKVLDVTTEEQIPGSIFVTKDKPVSE